MKGRKVDRLSPKKITMNCLCSGEQLDAHQVVRSSDSLATKDGSVGGYSSQTGDGEQKIDMANIEEAESSLREGGCLNFEVALSLIYLSPCYLALSDAMINDKEFMMDKL